MHGTVTGARGSIGGGSFVSTITTAVTVSSAAESEGSVTAARRMAWMRLGLVVAACVAISVGACATSSEVVPDFAPVGDMDGDGVQDDQDACPELPGTVAQRGCPESTERRPAATEGEPCDRDSDCAEGLICVDPCGGDGREPSAQAMVCPGVCRAER